jgi:hypothetical protein
MRRSQSYRGVSDPNRIAENFQWDFFRKDMNARILGIYPEGVTNPLEKMLGFFEPTAAHLRRKDLFTQICEAFESHPIESVFGVTVSDVYHHMPHDEWVKLYDRAKVMPKRKEGELNETIMLLVKEMMSLRAGGI